MFAGQPAFTNVSGGSLTDDGSEHNSKRLLLSRIHACPILDKLFKFSLVMRTFQAWQAGTANVVPRKMRRAMSAAKPYRSRRVSGRPPVRQQVSHSAAMAGRRDLQYCRPWTGWEIERTAARRLRPARLPKTAGDMAIPGPRMAAQHRVRARHRDARSATKPSGRALPARPRRPARTMAGT